MDFKERAIPIKKILLYLLCKWQLILFAGLIVAVVFSGAKFLFAIQDYKSEVETFGADSSTEELKELLSASELTLANNVLYLNESVNDLNDYLEHSALMSIDPYKKNVLTFQYEVKSTVDDPAVIMMAYRDSVNSGTISKQLMSLDGIHLKEEYLNELISIALDDTAYRDSNNRQSGTFILTLCGESEDWLNSISDDVLSAMGELSVTMQNSIGDHSLTLISSEMKTIYDENLASVQQSKYAQLKDMKTQLESECSSLSLGQKRYILSLCPDQGLFSSGVDNVKPQFSLKNVVYGFFLGIVVMALLVCCKLLFSGKLLSSDELRSYGIREIDCVNFGSKRFCNKFFSRGKKCAEENVTEKSSFLESVKCTSRNISLLCRHRNIKNLCVIDMGLSKERTDYADEVFQSSDFSDLIIEEEHFDETYSLLDSIEKADAVLLLIEEHSTAYRDLERTLSFLELHEIDLLGSVVFVV